ncbi:MAG: hypothetical protein NT062_28745 [Proteobacteria bacterium]|nr:hypothetical protein [Pseudomonadota bacterium]
MRPGKLVAWFGCGAVACIATSVAVGPAGILVGITASIVAVLWQLLWLPRAAHAAFARGRFGPAARRYRVLGVLALTRGRERAARLSRGACLLSMGALDDADQLHASLDAATFEPAERAVWLNNRACTLLARTSVAHADEALALALDAVALRPDVPAMQHTRGQALLALGRVDDAIGVLDAMHVGAELPPRLEAERCRDLARAWDAKGQPAYAADYRARANSVIGAD